MAGCFRIHSLELAPSVDTALVRRVDAPFAESLPSMQSWSRPDTDCKWAYLPYPQLTILISLIVGKSPRIFIFQAFPNWNAAAFGNFTSVKITSPGNHPALRSRPTTIYESRTRVWRSYLQTFAFSSGCFGWDRKLCPGAKLQVCRKSVTLQATASSRPFCKCQLNIPSPKG